jgi:hypothetical protein
VVKKANEQLSVLQLDGVAIRTDPRLKRVREAVAGAHAALVAQVRTNRPFHLQLNLNDPPDLYFCQPSPENPLQPLITHVEHTTYNVARDGDLSEHLLKAKLAGDPSPASNTLLLVEAEDDPLEINVRELQHHLEEHGVVYQLWVMVGSKFAGSTEVKVVAFNTPTVPTTRIITARLDEQLAMAGREHQWFMAKRAGQERAERLQAIAGMIIEPCDSYQGFPWPTLNGEVSTEC